jgi:hypothetical protein
MEDKLKLIAFYLPQYHPIAENDEWWGRGFTEWTNVSKAFPNFSGHYQPHLPSDLGFYDLRLAETREQQAELARKYGIYGFCYHHYWFGGKRLLERPFNDVLKSGQPDFPFCLCWANENWTRRWDGAEHQILIAQQHSPEDDLAFIQDIIPAFKDPRYIRINNKPLLIVYRVSLLPDPQSTVNVWHEEVKKHGLEGIYLVAAQSFSIKSPLPYGFDAAVEFPPHNARGTWINNQLEITNPLYTGNVFDYARVAANHILHDLPEETDYPLFHTVMPSWDNAARRQSTCHTFYNSSPEHYHVWLKEVIRHTREHHPAGEQIVFINAWNEWAEGCHLEPDQKYGHSYLQATEKALNDNPGESTAPDKLPLTFLSDTPRLKYLLRIPGTQPEIKDVFKWLAESDGLIFPFDGKNYSEIIHLSQIWKKAFCIEIELGLFEKEEGHLKNKLYRRIFNLISLHNYLRFNEDPVVIFTYAAKVSHLGDLILGLSQFTESQGISLHKCWGIHNELNSGLLKFENEEYYINHSFYRHFNSMTELQPGYCFSLLERMGSSPITENKVLATIPNIPVRHDTYFPGYFFPENASKEAFTAHLAQQITQCIKNEQPFLISCLSSINTHTLTFLQIYNDLKKKAPYELEEIHQQYLKNHTCEITDSSSQLRIFEEKYVAYYPEGKNTYNRLGIFLRRIYSRAYKRNNKFVTGIFHVTGKFLYLIGFKKTGNDFLNMKKYIG